MDNHSTDGTVNWLKEQVDIKTIFNSKGLGYSKGCNQGIKLSQGDNILLLNNDVVVTKHWLSNLERCLFSAKNIGVVGPLNNYPSYYQNIGVSYTSMEEMQLFVEKFNISDEKKWEERLKLIGFCMLIKREVIEKVGLLDEFFTPINFEDDDYCLRIREAGYRVMLCKDTFVHHFGSATQKENIYEYDKIFKTNKKKFEDKWKIDWLNSMYIRYKSIKLIDKPESFSINVLEIGCGCGATLLKIRDIYKNAKLYAIEENTNEAQFAKVVANVKEGNIKNCELDYKDESFDYIILSYKTGEFQVDKEVLIKIKRYLKMDGKIIISKFIGPYDETASYYNINKLEEEKDKEMLEEKAKNFFIKETYMPRYNDQYLNKNISSEINDMNIYSLAQVLGEKYDCEFIIDIGCSNYKGLNKLKTKFKIIGFDIKENVEKFKRKYNFINWIEFKFIEGLDFNIPKEILEKSIIICSNTIQQLIDPTNLLLNLKKIMEFSPVCLIGATERNLCAGENHNGPPSNVLNLREWNKEELKSLLDYYGLNILFQGLVYSDRSFSKKENLLSIIGNKKISLSGIDKFKVVAIVFVYNEEDIIYESVKKLVKNGIDVYLIDNWSKDSTLKIVKKLDEEGLLIGWESFPESGPTKTFDLYNQMKRLEELTKIIKADWFIHRDADEISEGPWSNLNLKESIYTVDQMGFNAVNNAVITFKPIDDNFQDNLDFEEYFRYFEMGKGWSDFHQIKAWKNLSIPISLAHVAGHEVHFEGMRVFPYKFLLKHYPIRGQRHGEKKVFRDRKARWNKEEREKGWHVHYDRDVEGQSFICNPNNLIYYTNKEELYMKFFLELISGIGIEDFSYSFTML
mgnify:CR=1 FL=1